MPTLEDVAEKAQVSVSTASRILTRDRNGRFSDETRQRVLNAAREIGYRPNLAARSLISGQSNIIGFVSPRVVDTPFTALRVLQILTHIEIACSERGYHLLLSSPRYVNGALDEHYMQLLSSGYLDGLIIHDENVNFSLLEPALEFGIPAVVIGNREHPYFVNGDDYLGGALQAEHLLQLGHRHIGVIGLPDNSHYAARLRLRGVMDVASRMGVSTETFYRRDGDFTSESGLAAAHYLLTHHPEITALLVNNDRMAIGALQAARQMGLRVPQDISIIGFDNLPQSADTTPPLTTIDQSVELWGEAAVAMLLRVRQGEQPVSRMMDTRLVIRETTSAPRTGGLR
ncbi:LacI family DNA-binding transcriptional regulator [Oscillatoria laete-virens NRMC-F 0139]|nr:LacI family DNA-binding transcriptional regulator [Oscillatoria laete-virens]MDL5055295.1 LacI family DNA-binding transcriptional regulator [Oscillatoria laete-virens NRMC-F 0139]